MKNLFIVALLISCVFQFGISQNLEVVNAEKFDFKEVIYDDNTGFNSPAIMCNHISELSYSDSGYDPMGLLSGSLLLRDDGEVYYAGTFNADSEVRLLDINLNEITKHQTILLDLDEACSFYAPEEADLNFDFPEFENMTGIINYSSISGSDSFWTTYILTTENWRPNLWSAGDLTIITGAATDGELKYVNPDGTAVELNVYSGFNQYLIAIDKFGVYQWSYVINGNKNGFDVGGYQSVVAHNDEIVVVSIQGFGSYITSKLLYFDYSGNEVREPIEFPRLGIFKLEFDDYDRMMMCGSFDENADDTNLDLNGGEYFLDVNPVQNINGFFIQYSPNGDVNWVQTVEGPVLSGITSFDYTDDYIYLTGQVTDYVIFDINGDNATVFDSLESANLFISKYSDDGNMEWASVFYNEGHTSGGAEVSIEEDIVSIFGWFRSEFDADPDPEQEHILSVENPDIDRSHLIIDFREFPVSTSDLDKGIYSLSPNPANSILKTSNNDEKIVSIKCLAGNIVGQYNASSIDVSDLPSGMYIVNTENNGAFKSQLVSILH